VNSLFITPHPSFTLRAPAKINWTLYVLNKREDGYHNILSLMHCVNLYDTLIFEHASGIELIASMDIPIEQNLVYKAAVILKEYTGTKAGAKIVLKKEIPSGAGLGGGSSDAACALTGLNRLWRLGLPADELKTIGSRIGSDVPFFVNYYSDTCCPLAVVESRGEALTPLKIDKSSTLLLVKPSISISTAWAYEKISLNRTPHFFQKVRGQDSKKLTKTRDKINNIKLIYNALKTGDMSFVNARIHNDFEGAVIEEYPVIGSLKEELLNVGASMAIMSGSGSTVFGLFDNRDKAVSASRKFSSYWNRVVETIISS